MWQFSGNKYRQPKSSLRRSHNDPFDLVAHNGASVEDWGIIMNRVLKDFKRFRNWIETNNPGVDALALGSIHQKLVQRWQAQRASDRDLDMYVEFDM